MGYLDGYYESALYGHQNDPQMMPSPDRYAPFQAPGRQVETGPRSEDPMTVANENWQANMDLVRRGSDVAKFAMQDVFSYRDRMRRAVDDDDYEGLSRLVSEVDAFVDEHYNDLRPWTTLQNNGAQGKMLASILGPVVGGGYKTDPVWLGTARLQSNGTFAPGSSTATIAGVLDQDTPEYRQRQARKLVDDEGLSEGAAAAIVDRTNPKHAMYSRFKTLSSSLAVRGDDPRTAKAERDREVLLANNIAQFDDLSEEDPALRFPSDVEKAQFVKAAIQEFTKSGVMLLSRDRLAQLARGYLSQTKSTATDYLKQVAEAKDMLTTVAGPAGQPERSGGVTNGQATISARMADHEAFSVAAKSVARAAELGASELVGSKSYNDAIVLATDQLRKTASLYGVDLRRLGQTSDLAVDMALASFGVAGADKGQLAMDYVNQLGSTLGRLMSDKTTDVLGLTLGKQGETVVTTGSLRGGDAYAPAELAMVKAAGKALYDMSFNGTTFQGIDHVMRRLEREPEARSRVWDAMRDALAPHLRDRGLAQSVSEQLLGQLVASPEGEVPRRTLKDILTEKATLTVPMMDPDSGRIVEVPKVPAPVRLDTAKVAFNASEVVALSTGRVLATTDGEREIRTDLVKMAAALSEVEGKGDKQKTKDGLPVSAHNFWRPLGDIYKRKVVGPNAEEDLVTTGSLAKLLTRDRWTPNADPSDPNRGDKVIRAWLQTPVAELGVSNAPLTPAQSSRLLQMILARGAYGTIFDNEPGFSGFNAAGVYHRTSARMVSMEDHVADWFAARLGAPRKNMATVVAKFRGAGKTDALLDEAIRVMPELVNAPLVTSGLLRRDPEGHWSLDPKNMLAKLQGDSYRDPINNIRTEDQVSQSGSLEERYKSQLAMNERKAARRALALFGGENELVGSALYQLNEHAQSQGLYGQPAALYLANAKEQVVSAYRQHGAAGLADAVQRMRAHRMYYYPAFNDKGDVLLNQYETSGSRLESPEEYEAHKNRIRYNFRKTHADNVKFDDGLFANAMVYGPGWYAEQQRLAMITLQRQAAEAGKAPREEEY